MIESGIKQPLRFYDAIGKQNFRREWANDTGLTEHNVLINPYNTIVPFQIRRVASLNPIVLFDLYTYNDITGDFYYDLDVFSIMAGSSTDHLRVVQVSDVDNIIWNPISNFTNILNCGFHYVYLSDGVSEWWSEVFRVYNFDSSQITGLDVGSEVPGLNESSMIGWTSGGIDYEIIISNNPI